MYSAFLERTLEAIDALVRHIRASDQFRSFVFEKALSCKANPACFNNDAFSPTQTPGSLEWRVIDHCTVVTRVYAIYEEFSHEMIKEHLGILQRRLAYSELPEKIPLAYRSGLAKILEKKDGPRYRDLDLSKLVSDYNAALTGSDYVIEPRAMLIHEQNLRLPELERLMGACGVDGVRDWIASHEYVTSFFAAEDRLSDTAENQMSELIKYRNEAAHGSIDIGSILNANFLIEFCEFISVICRAIAEKVQIASIDALESRGHASLLGKAVESFRGDFVAVGAVTGELEIGDTVYLCGKSYCLERKVLSLQIDDAPQTSVNFEIPTELGVGFDAPGRKNALIKILKPRRLRDGYSED